MTLGTDVSAQLPYLRSEAVSRFTEVFEFFSESVGRDPVTFERVTVRTVLATVPGRLRAQYPNAAVAGEPIGQPVVVQRLDVHVAVGSHAAKSGELVRILSSSMDAESVGRVFRVLDSPVMGQVTAWRTPVEDYGRHE